MWWTVTVAGPMSPTGVVAVIVVAVTVPMVAAAPPTDTVAPESNAAPVIVMTVPPPVVPALGVTAAGAGGGPCALRVDGRVALRVSMLVMVTGSGPMAGATEGMAAVTCPDVTTTTPVAGTPPTVTVAPAAKLLPMSVIVAPPPFEGVAGVTFVSVSAGPCSVNPPLSVTAWLSTFVKVMSRGPITGAMFGMTIAALVPDNTFTEATGTPPSSTVAPATKLVPVRVTAAPPVLSADAGLAELMVGVRPSALWPAASVALRASTFVTSTATGPSVGATAGVTAVIVVGPSSVTLVAATPFTVMPAPATKLVPVRVMVVPPPLLPDAGATAESVGAGPS